MNIMNINEIIVQTARKYIGMEEIKGNSGFKNPLFWLKMEGVGFQKGDAWCCLFGELVWRESYGNYDSTYDNILNKMFSKSVMKTWDNLQKCPFLVNKTPGLGALVFFQHYSKGKALRTGHLGIEVELPVSNHIINVEGNTNGVGGREGVKVAEKKRMLDFATPYNGLKMIGFAHPLN